MIPVSQFEELVDKTSDCDIESMKDKNEHFQDDKFEENVYESCEICETSSEILLPSDLFQKSKLGIMQKFNLLLARFVKLKL